jgi:hypothetical protein
MPQVNRYIGMRWASLHCFIGQKVISEGGQYTHILQQLDTELGTAAQARWLSRVPLQPAWFYMPP